MNDFLTIGRGTPSPTRSLTDYIAEGKNFWEACRQLRYAQRRGEKEEDYRQQIDGLKEFMSLLRMPNQAEQSPIIEMWIPSNPLHREERFHNYLLWKAFTTPQNRQVYSCPAIEESILLQALHSGNNDFEQKHHIFNLLVARGFPQSQARILAKYIYLPNHLTVDNYEQ